jgi:hypothetical protein
MSEYAQKKHLARIAGDIIFSDHYMDLLESTYSDPAAIREFEAGLPLGRMGKERSL